MTSASNRRRLPLSLAIIYAHSVLFRFQGVYSLPVYPRYLFVSITWGLEAPSFPGS